MADVVVEPSVFFGDATCPRCGQLLWFIQPGNETHVFDLQRTSEARDRVIDIIAEQLGADRAKIANRPYLFRDLGADSLDTIELVMELEEELEPQ